MQEQITIDAYSLVDLLVEVQKYVQEGYVVEMTENSTFPQQYATRFVVTIVLASTEEPDTVDAPKRGRKPKA